MAGLCWMAVTLGLLLSVGNSSADVKIKWLEQLTVIVDDLWDRYKPSFTDTTGKSEPPMFSLAVSIPYTEDNNKKKEYHISQVINSADDSPDKVKESILKCEVYKGTRVVAARALKWRDVVNQCPDEKVQWSIVPNYCKKKPKMTWTQLEKKYPNVGLQCTTDHAEFRVLQNFDTLKNQNKNDLMLFYVRDSPCVEKCTKENHQFNILTKIKDIKKKWTNFAFVFSYVFHPPGKTVPDKELIGALKRLGSSIGRENIYRCDGLKECESCFSGNDVNSFCYTDNNKQSTSASAPSQSGQGKTAQKQKNTKPGAPDEDEWIKVGQKGKKTNEAEGVSSS